MDETRSQIMQQTPPPSPYLETKWDLQLDRVSEGLLHPKEKKLGYLELYFSGFMEFVDTPLSPDMSDDDTEYPRWGRSSRRQDPMPNRTVSETTRDSDASSADESRCPLLYSETATKNDRRQVIPNSVLASSKRRKISPMRLQRRKARMIRRSTTNNAKISKSYLNSTVMISRSTACV